MQQYICLPLKDNAVDARKYAVQIENATAPALSAMEGVELLLNHRASQVPSQQLFLQNFLL